MVRRAPQPQQQRSQKTLLNEALAATRPAFTSAIVFSFFINLLVFVGPLYMLQVYDRVLTSRNETTLVMLTLIAGFLLVVYAILETLRSRILVRAGVRFDEVASVPVFNTVLKGMIHQPGGGHTQALRDVDTVREFLTGSGLISFCDAPWVPIFIAGCFLLHPYFGFIALAGSILIFSLALGNEFSTRKILGQASRSSVAANTHAASTFRNSEVLHAMGMLPGLRQRWAARHEEVLDWQAAASDRAGIFVAGTKFVRMFLQIAILGTGAFLAIEGVVSPGAMIAASIIMGRALAPVEMAVGNWKHFVAARSSYGRVQSLLQAHPPAKERMSLPAPRGFVSVENLVVAPPGKPTAVIRGVSFSLAAGEILGVVGPNSAGKSSLARALVGVWPAAAGAIRLDGSELAHWESEDLGRHIGYLPQDVELFSGTVEENISRFQAADSEKVITAARLAGVHELAQQLPEGYNTEIGDSGTALSGGQRQRIALARAVYGPPALIVLDEPNASLDSAGEVALLEAVRTLKAQGVTLVLVTHKPNILSVVDKILILNNGQVQSFGGRDEILARLMGPRVVSSSQQPAGIASSGA